MQEKLAYLTIDDGPSLDFVQKVDHLLSKGIPAIWFCRGDYLEERPEDVSYAIKKGFIIGNHSYSHPHFSDLSIDECREQIQKTDATIRILYEKLGITSYFKFFRFPYGDQGDLRHGDLTLPLSAGGRTRKDMLQNYLKELDYTPASLRGITYQYYQTQGSLDDIDWRWTFDAREYRLFITGSDLTSLEQVLERMDRDSPETGLGLNNASSNEILLVHDHLQSTQFFKQIIDKLASKKMQFIIPS